MSAAKSYIRYWVKISVTGMLWKARVYCLLGQQVLKVAVFIDVQAHPVFSAEKTGFEKELVVVSRAQKAFHSDNENFDASL